MRYNQIKITGFYRNDVGLKDLATVVNAAGMPGDAIAAGLTGNIAAFTDAARKHIGETRCGIDVGSFEYKEVPAHTSLRGSSRKVALFGGHGNGVRASCGFYGEPVVEIYINDINPIDSAKIMDDVDKVLSGLRGHHDALESSGWNLEHGESEAA